MRSKFNAKKTVVDGETFDSEAEARRWQHLRLLERAGKIRGLERQIKFEVFKGFTNGDGKKVRPINYIADFVYTEIMPDCRDGEFVVEDCKGFRTQEYKIKKKLFEWRYRPTVIKGTK